MSVPPRSRPPFAPFALLAAGVLTALVAWSQAALARAGVDAAEALLLLAGAVLVAAALQPGGRLAGIVAAASIKASHLVLAPQGPVVGSVVFWLDLASWGLLLGAAFVLARDAWRESRWDRGLTLEG